MKDFLVPAGDVFGIEKRIREVDDGYRIFYNKKLNRFEIHNLNQKSNDTLALVVPFDSIDSRIVPWVRKTRAENVNSIIKKIEEDNNKLLEKQQKSQAEVAKYKSQETLLNIKSKLENLKI
jgi:hypothetical protein